MLLFLEGALLTDFFQVAICYSRPVARNRSAFQVRIRPKADLISIDIIPPARALLPQRIQLRAVSGHVAAAPEV